jgi:transcriptional regulator with XRE-family HTH domain
LGVNVKTLSDLLKRHGLASPWAGKRSRSGSRTPRPQLELALPLWADGLAWLRGIERAEAERLLRKRWVASGVIPILESPFLWVIPMALTTWLGLGSGALTLWAFLFAMGHEWRAPPASFVHRLLRIALRTAAGNLLMDLDASAVASFLPTSFLGFEVSPLATSLANLPRWADALLGSTVGHMFYNLAMDLLGLPEFQLSLSRASQAIRGGFRKQVVAQRIRDLMRQRYPSQQAFAEAVGAYPTAVSYWVNGAWLPEPSAWPNVARALAKPVAYFFTGGSDRLIAMREAGFGARLMFLRLEHGLYQTQLAQQLGVNFQAISFLESGQRPPPTNPTFLQSVAQALGVSLSFLLTGVEVEAVGSWVQQLQAELRCLLPR